MSTDISQLNLQEPDQIDWAGYQLQSTGGGKAIPPAGTYQGAAPSTFDYQDKDGKLVVLMDPITILGPTNAGYALRFTRVSTKKYSNRNASPAGDYLKAQGVPSQPRTNQDYVDAVESTAGRPFQFDLDWEAWDKETQETLAKGMDAFPDNATGGKQPFIVTADGRKVWANARIKRFRPAV